MSKQPKTFENKGKKKTRLPRESLWRDGLSFSKWWRCRESKIADFKGFKQNQL